MSERPAVLVIAGVDSSGGAGLARDLAVLAEFGITALCAVTAVTAQTNTEVVTVHPVPPKVLDAQIKAAFATRRIDAVKIGMLGTRAAIDVVIEALPARDQVPLVVDPVLVSSSGRRLLDDAGLDRLYGSLLPRASLVTPNLAEAAALLGEPLAQQTSDKLGRARRLLATGVEAVLLKGGHDDGAEAIDLLVTRASTVTRLAAPRVHASMRGTGCALSTAIAARLACGLTLEAACGQAKRYVHGKLRG